MRYSINSLGGDLLKSVFLDDINHGLTSLLSRDELEDGITHTEDLDVVVLIEFITKIEAFTVAFKIDSKDSDVGIDFILIFLDTRDDGATSNIDIRVTFSNHHIG